MSIHIELANDDFPNIYIPILNSELLFLAEIPLFMQVTDDAAKRILGLEGT